MKNIKDILLEKNIINKNTSPQYSYDTEFKFINGTFRRDNMDIAMIANKHKYKYGIVSYLPDDDVVCLMTFNDSKDLEAEYGTEEGYYEELTGIDKNDYYEIDGIFYWRLW